MIKKKFDLEVKVIEQLNYDAYVHSSNYTDRYPSLHACFMRTAVKMIPFTSSKIILTESDNEGNKFRSC